jgi:hypothetical protein
MLMQAQRGVGLIAPTHSQLVSRREWVVSLTLWPFYFGKDPVRFVYWVGLVAGLYSTENLASSGIRFPDRPACCD